LDSFQLLGEIFQSGTQDRMDCGATVGRFGALSFKDGMVKKLLRKSRA
jgi:hypothetical protein